MGPDQARGVTLTLADSATILDPRRASPDRYHLETRPGVESDGTRYLAAIRPIGPVNPLGFRFHRLPGRLIPAT
jgi:hypothetical protein